MLQNQVWRSYCQYFPFELGFRLRSLHRAGLKSLISEIRSAPPEVYQWWARRGIPVAPHHVVGVLGDPHQGHEARSFVDLPLRLMIKGRSYIWKPGRDRYRLEKALQDVIRVLGPASGLVPIDSVEWGRGGLWQFVMGSECHLEKKGLLSHLHYRGLAHLLILAGCFGLGDLHFENIFVRPDGLRVIDAECFGGPPLRHDRNSSGLTVFLERLNESILLNFTDDEEVRAGVMSHLDEALCDISAKWDLITAITQPQEGVQSRVVWRGTDEYFKLMPFAIRDGGALLHSEYRHLVPDGVSPNREEVVRLLAKGVIPRHTLPAQMELVSLADVRAGVRVLDAAMRAREGKGQEALKFYFQTLRSIPIRQNEFVIDCGEPRLHFQGGLRGSAPLVQAMIVALAEEAADLTKMIPVEGGAIGIEVALKELIAAPARKEHRGLGLGLGGVLNHVALAVEAGLLDQRHALAAIELGLTRARASFGKPYDLLSGDTGLLLGLSRLFCITRDARLHESVRLLVRRISDYANETIRIAPTAFPFGVGHGHAGVLWALHEAEVRVGVKSEAKGRLIAILQAGFQGVGPLAEMFENDPSTTVCRGVWGVRAVLNRMGEERGLCTPPKPLARGLCHGMEAVIAATGDGRYGVGIASLPAPAAMGDLLGGVLGTRWFDCSQKISLADPLFGEPYAQMPLVMISQVA